MYRYIVKRVLLVIPTLVGAAALVFLLMRLIPGDICVVRLGSGGGSFDERAVTACHAQLGLDHPIFLQFVDFVWGFFRGDFGTSMWSGKPVAYEIAARFPISLEICIMAVVISNIIAIPLGTISALKQDRPIDFVIRTISIAGLATPNFWLGILLILAILDISQAVFGTPWMPPIDYVPIWQDPLRNLSMAIWPALTVGYRTSAVTMRMTRSAMLEVLREDYIRTARAKGLIERVIINRHALKNALLPVVTLIGIEAAFLIGGLVVTEQVFNLNGIGRLFVQSVQNQDYTMTQALVMLVVAVFVLTNTVVDLIFAEWIAPYSPTANDFAVMTEPPSWEHLLGTDQFGRDQLSRIIFGARTALIVGFSCAIIASVAGLVLGVGSAYFGGRLDLYLQAVLDVVMAFPLIIMALAVVAIFGTGVHNVIVAITIPLIPRCARVLRSSALSIREVPYIDAARACGFGHRRIILRHMVPNVMAPYLILLTAFVGQAILAEASLSYLGLGVQEPVPAWGLMLQGGAEEYASTAPWIAIFPGLAIALTVFGFSLFGDALRDALDPKMRDR